MPKYRLKPGSTYTYEEFCDRYMKNKTGEQHDLDYYKEHGWANFPEKREVKHRYPRVFHSGRIPLYLEHWLRAGESVKEALKDTSIEWGDLSDYEALINFGSCWASQQGGDEYPFYLVSPKVGFLTLNTSSIKTPQLQELAWAMGEIFSAGIHPKAALKLGLSDGDSIEMKSPEGKIVEVKVRITKDVHPNVISVPGNVAKVLSPNEKELSGNNVHINSFLSYRLERIDMLSAALDQCVKVKVQKVHAARNKPTFISSIKKLLIPT